MTTEEKAKHYDKALESIKELYSKGSRVVVSKEEFETIFPELKESEDEKIRKEIEQLIQCMHDADLRKGRWIAWLEKQGKTNETINNNEFAQGVLRGAAINLITWIDYNAAEGNMCLSNVQCKEIENALVNGNWDKIYSYIKKKLEKQGEKYKWTQDDEQYLLVCKNALRKYQVSDKWDADIISKWLEDKLKQGEPKPKWTEEDVEIVSKLQCTLNHVDYDYDTHKKLDNWLKSIEHRMEE